MKKNIAHHFGNLPIRLFNYLSYLFIFREKNKKFAEQGAALAACASLGLIDKETLIKDGSILE